MADWVPVVAGIVVALIAGVATGSGWFLIRSQRGLNRADASSHLTGAAMDMVNGANARTERWQVRLEKCELRLDINTDRIKGLESENYVLRQGIGRLEGQLMSVGLVPVWKPPVPPQAEA